MRVHDAKTLYSASDLVNFMGCVHATALDIKALSAPVAHAPVDAQTELLQAKGLEHERAYLARLKTEGRSVVEISSEGTLEERTERTVAAMRAGADVIYQGALHAAPWHGYSDFLLKSDLPSDLGDWSYDVADTKLSRSAKPSHILQLCVYGELLSVRQGVAPQFLHVVLGNGQMATVRASSVRHYSRIAAKRFETFTAGDAIPTVGEPCGHCTYCKWRDACEAEWDVAEHLSLVAGITRNQIAKLRNGGIVSLSELAVSAADKIEGLNSEVLARLKSQAALQMHGRTTGESKVEVLPLVAGKGFDRLPLPDDGDLFFDMEGDPLVDEGLEYLFGFFYSKGGAETYLPLWAHDKTEEKASFENAVDLIVERLAQFPGAHIYHYASYEESALKRLAMFHGTRENEIDDLLRQGRLVDLYRTTREAIRISERGYSIKNLENLYLDRARKGLVKSAGESIVFYENWRATQDGELLEQIRAYNEFDCVSTKLCRDWILTLRPEGATWRSPGEAVPPTEEKLQKRAEAEERTEKMTAALVESGPDGDRTWRVLTANLLEFHRRESKPEYWRKFQRLDMTAEELLEDSESIALLSPYAGRPPRKEKRSTVHTYGFPPQDFKMRLGGEPLLARSGATAGEIVGIDEESGILELKVGPSKTPPIEGDSLIPPDPLKTTVLKEAVYRFAESVVAGATSYRALTDILARRLPRLKGLDAGAPLIDAKGEVVAETVVAVQNLDDSYLLIQGPPGAGKTYTSARAIVALLGKGARIGIASNSHKAINNLLGEVQKCADKTARRFTGVKKSTRDDQFANLTSIRDTTDNATAAGAGFQLYGGTAHFFARPEMNQSLDYLFVDEAGQVSLANLVAMGVAARNIVLVGDQMQLSQPIQGDHPGGSGSSGLEHLMDGMATVPPDRGIFLPETRRLHPDLCGFISEAVYDGRLKPHESTASRRIVLAAAAGAPIRASGLSFHPVEHVANTQRCPEEAD